MSVQTTSGFGGPSTAPIGNLGGRGLLTATQGCIDWHSLLRTRHLAQAGDHPGRIPERQLKRDFYRQLELDRGVHKYSGPSGAVVTRHKKDYGFVQASKQ